MLRRAIYLALVLGTVVVALPARAQDVEVTLDTFDTPLAEHGDWVDVGGYGRVWRPRHTGFGWRPYLHGQWVWTDDGWMWQSDEAWGWATYHYGRWSFEPSYGWIWVPGYKWAPAWVEWRYSEGTVGWAPLFPVGITVRPVVYDHWTFVPTHSFVGVRVTTVAYSSSQVQAHWSSTVAAPGTIHGAHPVEGSPHGAVPVFGGPPRTFVEHHIGRPIEVVRPVTVSTPGEISHHPGAVYRPSSAIAHPAGPSAGPVTAHPGGLQPSQPQTAPGTGVQPGPVHAGPSAGPVTAHPGGLQPSQPQPPPPPIHQGPSAQPVAPVHAGPSPGPMTTHPGGLQPSQPAPVHPVTQPAPVRPASQPASQNPTTRPPAPATTAPPPPPPHHNAPPPKKDHEHK